MIEYFMCLTTGYILAYAVYRRKTIPKKALLCIDGREIKLLKVKEYESVLQYGNRYWQKAKDSDYLLLWEIGQLLNYGLVLILMELHVF